MNIIFYKCGRNKKKTERGRFYAEKKVRKFGTSEQQQTKFLSLKKNKFLL